MKGYGDIKPFFIFKLIYFLEVGTAGAISTSIKLTFDVVAGDQIGFHVSGFGEATEIPAVVHKTGDEVISGVKTFQNNHSPLSSSIVIKSTDIVKGTASFDHNTGIVFADSTNNDPDTTGRLASVVYHSPANENSGYYTHLVCQDFYGSGNSVLRVGYDGDNVPYATAPATSDKRTESTDIVTRGYMEASEWNWQKTKKTRAVTFKPVPESDLEPVVDFMFTETPPAEGEKGPENPSTITGISNIGLNQLSNLCVFAPQRDRLSDLGDGWFGGTVDNSSSSAETYAGLLYPRYEIPIDTSKSYCVVVEIENCDTFIIGSQHNGFPGALVTSSPFATVSGTGKFKFDLVHSGFNNTQYIIRNTSTIAPGETKTYKLRVAVLQCKSSEVDLDKYVYSKPLNQYTIQLGDTYYGGSLDVATGVMTVTWVGGLVPVKGFLYHTDEIVGFQWDLGGNYTFTGGANTDTDIRCTHFINSTDVSQYLENIRLSGPTGGTAWGGFISINESRIGGSGLTNEQYLSNMQQYITNNSVMFAAKIYTPFTVQLTPTQIRSLPALDKYEPRINTVYTDQEAVQVGYQRYVGVVPISDLGDYSNNIVSSKWIKDLSAVEIYVDSVNGDNNNDGLTSSTAVKTIGKALEIFDSKPVSNKINHIWIAAGSTFNESLSIRDGKRILIHLLGNVTINGNIEITIRSVGIFVYRLDSTYTLTINGWVQVTHGSFLYATCKININVPSTSSSVASLLALSGSCVVLDNDTSLTGSGNIHPLYFRQSSLIVRTVISCYGSLTTEAMAFERSSLWTYGSIIIINAECTVGLNLFGYSLVYAPTISIPGKVTVSGIRCMRSSYLETKNVSISNSENDGQWCLWAENGSLLQFANSPSLSISGTFHRIVNVSMNSMFVLPSSPTITNNATGQKYFCDRGGQMYMSGGGTNILPGSTAGQVNSASFGYYA